MSQFWLLLCITLATIICYSQAQTPGPVSDLEWRGQRTIDEAPINRVAYAVHKLNDTMLVIAYSGIFTSGPAIRFVALTMDRNETGISSRTLFTRNFTNDIANITSGLHMVYDQGDVALVYQNASRMCLQTIGLRPPPSGGNQPPPPPDRAPPVNIGGEATFPHISTLSYPTTQRPYFSVVYSRDVHTGTINGTCLHHMYAAFDRIFSTLLLFCPISPDSPMDPFAEIWYHPDDLNSFFVISRAGMGNNFEVQRCTGVTTGVTCVGILTGSNGIPVASPIDMVASRRIQNNQFWFAWRASDNHVVSIISIIFDQTSVSKVSNVYNTSLAADSFNLVDSLNPEGVTLVLNMASVVYHIDYAWDSNATITQNKMFTLETATLDSYNNPFSLAAESLDNSVFALVSTFSGRASLNYFAVPFCGNSLVSPGLEECDILTQGCNSSCQCVMGPNPSGGCLTNETPSGFIPSSVPGASGTVEPVSGPNNEDKTIQTVVPSVVIPVVVVGVSVAVLVVLLKRRKKSKKVKDDKVRLEPSNYQPMPGTNPTLPNDSKSSQAASGEHVSIPIGLAPLNTMSSDDRMKIPYSDLKVIREIGSGAYGKVFLGEWQMTQVALKVSGMTSSEEFIREAELLINLRPHPNVVQILGVSTDGLNVVMIMEYCDGSSLDHLIKGEVSMQTKIKYLSGIAKGIYHLHKNNIIHRDLAARNILLSRGEPKISDFGMSRKVQEAALHGQTRSTIGPLRWMAPESLKSAQYSSKSDVWSFGILVWEVLAGKEPHLDSDPLAIGIEIRDKGFAPIIPDDVNPELTQLMKDCWQIDPAMRPDFAEICKRINRIQS